LRVINFKLNKEHIFQFAKDFFIILSILLLTLYIVGYFEVRMVDTLAVGFGRDKLNLLGIFDSTNTADNLSFSWILPDLKHSYGEETEGFNFFGLGQIIIVLFAFSLFFNKNYKINLQSIKNNKEIKAFFIISLFFTLWALSNKISLGPYTLIEIPLNKYIFGILSIVRPTGRLFWVVNYFLLALSLIIIFKCFDKKKSIAIISFLLIIQIADTSAGIKQRLNLFMPVDNNRLLGDKIWKDLFAKYKIVKTTYPKNYSGLFHKFSYSLEKYNIEKTNIVKLARVNREAVADAKYNLYKIFRQKKLPSDTLYVIDNLGQLRHLKYIFADENVGFFYRDNVWVMVVNERELMNVNDEKALGEIKPKLLEINDKKNLNIGETDNYYGFGWSHNFGKSGIWSEGSISTLLFRHDRDNEDLILEAACRPYLAKNSNILEF